MLHFATETICGISALAKLPGSAILIFDFSSAAPSKGHADPTAIPLSASHIFRLASQRHIYGQPQLLLSG